MEQLWDDSYDKYELNMFVYKKETVEYWQWTKEKINEIKDI